MKMKGEQKKTFCRNKKISKVVNCSKENLGNIENLN